MGMESVLDSVNGAVPNMNAGSLNKYLPDFLKPGQQKQRYAADFTEGFIIEVLKDTSGTIERKIRLLGNQMPFTPFKFAGDIRSKKEFYAGNPEPCVQIMGPNEKDVVIKGNFKDTRYPEVYNGKSAYGTSWELMNLINKVRYEGKLCKFRLGEWVRYGFIQDVDFDIIKKSRINYQITLMIVSYFKPTNAKFVQEGRSLPVATELIKQGEDLQSSFNQFPSDIPISFADKIRNLVAAVAGAFKLLTDFVDKIISTIQDVQKAVERAKGFIKFAQAKLKELKNFIANFDPFDTASAINAKYAYLKYARKNVRSVNLASATLNRFKQQFIAILGNLPLRRYLIKENDSLQGISTKFYGTADNWKKIFEYNNLTTSALPVGQLLEIPRL